jgi:signal transduction histidine kinase
MTSRSSTEAGVDRTVAAAALCRAVLLGRAVVTVTAAGAGLLIVAHPERVVAVLALVVASTALEVAALTRWPGVVRRTAAVLVLDTALLGAILALNTGSAAFFLFTAGAAALAGVLLGMRAWPLWALHAAIGFVAAATVLRADGVTPEVSAFVVAFPMATVVTGLVAASITAATVRHVDLLVEVIAAAQRAAAASERTRLARELHDSVAKTLRGVSFAALALPASLRSRPALAEQLADVVSQGADAAAREARELIEGLRLDNPDEPFDLGIERMCREWSISSRTPVRVTADPVEPALSTRYELSRILHEALGNVARHADARRVDVWLRRAGEGVRLVVRDDGNGFSVPPDLGTLRSGGHFGVLGMAERARTIGGEFIVRSAPSDGTLIEVLAPLAAPPPAPAGRDAIGPGLRGQGRHGAGPGSRGAIGPGQS